jgi:ribosomal protein S18 acetylase RimI-like enzyme
VVGLLREAGNPYCDWFFGGAEHAECALGAWLERSSSELFGGHVSVFRERGRVEGIVVAVPGSELDVYRTADTLATLAEARERRAVFRERLEVGRRLFLPVPSDSLYLSRLAVVSRARGRGLGRALLAEFLRAGRSGGFRRFDLDVAVGNTAAIRLYESFGFRVEAARAGGGMRYQRMVLTDEWPH